MTPPAVANGSLTGTPELISGEANAVNIRVADIKIIQNTKKIIHNKNYKYTPTDAINACVYWHGLSSTKCPYSLILRILEVNCKSFTVPVN